MRRRSWKFSSPSAVEEVVQQTSVDVGDRREARQDPGSSRRGAHDEAVTTWPIFVSIKAKLHC